MVMRQPYEMKHQPIPSNVSQFFGKSILLDIFGITPNSFGILLTHREASDAKVLRDVPDYKGAEAGV